MRRLGSIRRFHAQVRPDLAAALRRFDIAEPTSIQQKALPLALSGADVLVKDDGVTLVNRWNCTVPSSPSANISTIVTI